MISWIDRFRVALILSPALMLMHVWILACSNGYLYQTLGTAKSLALIAMSSVVEAYVIVMAITSAIQLWQKKASDERNAT